MYGFFNNLFRRVRSKHQDNDGLTGQCLDILLIDIAERYIETGDLHRVGIVEIDPRDLTGLIVFPTGFALTVKAW